ncbi:MAG: hypothetical protein Q9168_006441 [Polycauliona sp. 1 TL-2023]
MAGTSRRKCKQGVVAVAAHVLSAHYSTLTYRPGPPSRHFASPVIQSIPSFSIYRLASYDMGKKQESAVMIFSKQQASKKRAALVTNAGPSQPTQSTPNENKAPSPAKRKTTFVPSPGKEVPSSANSEASTAKPEASSSNPQQTEGKSTSSAKHTSQLWVAEVNNGAPGISPKAVHHLAKDWDEREIRKDKDSTSGWW